MAADAGVRMDYHRIGVFSADGGYASGTESFFNPGNVPVSYSLAVPQGAYRFGEGNGSPMGSQIRMRWAPGDQFGGVDGVNFAPDAGIWSPQVAPDDPNPQDPGISPDGLIYVPDNQSSQTVNLHATFPGPWMEQVYFLSLHDGTDPAAPDDYFQDLNIFIKDVRSYSVVPGRANAVVSNRNFSLSSLTVVLRVKNRDGSFRPFGNPSATIDFPIDANESFSVNTRRGDAVPLRPLYTLRMLLPVSTVNIVPHALVPENPDGTGTQSQTDFPALTGVQIPAPATAGTCSAVCVDSLTGQQFPDDATPPAICTTAANLSASTQVSITVTPAPVATPKKSSGCGCATADPSEVAGFAMLLALLFRRRARASTAART